MNKKKQRIKKNSFFSSANSSHPDESDNFKKAGHSSEATQQAKAASLRENQSWEMFHLFEEVGRFAQMVFELLTVGHGFKWHLWFSSYH